MKSEDRTMKSVPAGIHVDLPEVEAMKDFKDGNDIGHNPYPKGSKYWHRYRDAFTDMGLKDFYSEQQISAMGGEPTGPYEVNNGDL